MKGLLGAIIFCVGCSNTVSTTTQSTATNDVDTGAADAAPASIVLSIEAVDETSADGVQSRVKFVVSNTTEHEVSWLSWNTPFEEPLSANIFQVSLDGMQRDYQGRLIKRGQPSPEHYLTVPASDSLQTIIDIAKYYDVSQSGSYTVQLDTSKLTSVSQSKQELDVSVASTVVTLFIP